MKTQKLKEGINIYLAEGESQYFIASKMISVNTEYNILKPLYKNDGNYSFRPLNDVVGFSDINSYVITNEETLPNILVKIITSLNAK